VYLSVCDRYTSKPSLFNVDDLFEGVRDAFVRVIAQGYESQALEAYNRFHKLIYPDTVQANLADDIVLVYCTLEKELFSKRDNRGTSAVSEWQFYANLIKIQVLKQAQPTKSSATVKRRFAHGYGSDDPSGSDGTPNPGEPIARKPVRFTVPAND
jgi:hypothetical protein